MKLSGEWWSTPEPSLTWATTRSRDGLGALELLLEEDSFDLDHACVWRVRIDGAPRVHEITDPAARLVDAYPLQVTASRRGDWYDTTGEYRDWFIPDWPAVAADYDAVHLTVRSYLTTPGTAIPLTDRPGSTGSPAGIPTPPSGCAATASASRTTLWSGVGQAKVLGMHHGIHTHPPSECEPERRQLERQLLAQVEDAIRVGLEVVAHFGEANWRPSTPACRY